MPTDQPADCSARRRPAKPFTPVAFPRGNISLNPDNAKYTVRVFYRTGRKEDAEHVVGALLTAGYKSDGVESSLDEVITPNRSPDTTLIKTTAQARPALDGVVGIVKIAIPVKAAAISLFPEDATLRNADLQVLLF